MLLSSIRLILRHDECSNIQIDHFHREVERICVWVKGKCDTDKVNRLIWADEENPEFCLVQHLMVYLRNAFCNHHQE